MARSDRLHPVTCQSCGTEANVDDEGKRLGGYYECPICGADINLDAAFADADEGEDYEDEDDAGAGAGDGIDGHEVRSPLQPLPRAARRDLREYGIKQELPSDHTGRNGGVVVADRPPADLLEQYELRLVEAPDEVWTHDRGARVNIYEAAECVEIDGREASMSVADAKRRCRQSDAFSRVEDDHER